MPRFIVRFMKDVLGEEGQLFETCQSTIELNARNQAEAESLATQKFCAIHATHDWSLHADRVKIEAADFPS